MDIYEYENLHVYGPSLFMNDKYGLATFHYEFFHCENHKNITDLTVLNIFFEINITRM